MERDTSSMIGNRPGSLLLSTEQPPCAVEVIDQAHINSHDSTIATTGLVRALCSSPVESEYDNLITDDSPVKIVTEQAAGLQNGADSLTQTSPQSDETEALISSKNDVASNSSSSCIVSSSSSCSIIDDVDPVVTVNVPNQSSNSSKSWKCKLGNITNIDTVSSQMRSRLLDFYLSEL